MVYIRQRDMAQAWREARLIQYQAHIMQGAVQSQLGDYEAAHSHYLAALALTEDLTNDKGLAQTHNNLAILEARRGDIEKAVYHFQQGLYYYQQTGDSLNAEIIRNNLAAMYIQSKQYQNAIEWATTALTFFQRINNSHWIANCAVNLAEAYRHLNNSPQAQQFAQLVLAQEEPYSTPYALFTLAHLKWEAAETAVASQLFADTARLASENEDKFMQAYTYQAWGELLLAQEDLAEAKNKLTQALSLFNILEIEEERTAVETQLAKLS